MTAPRITLYTRDGCHLCADARTVIRAVAGETGEQWREVDVDADPEDRAEYGDLVPVVLVDGAMHGYYIVDAGQLRQALAR